MNCQSVQNRILSLPDPRQVPDALRAHLDGCPDCLRWWRQAARLERLLSELPAPPAPAGKKEALIDELTAAGPVIKAIPATPSVPSPGLAFLRRNWKPVAGLAAAVLVAVGVWQLFPRPGNNPVATVAPPHQLLSNMVQREVELAAARDPERKLEVFGAIADDLTAETRALARVSNAGEIDDLARWFEKTVDGGIVAPAKGLVGGRTLTPAETAARVQLLDGLATKLSNTAREVDGLVMESPEAARPALKRIVEKARSGQDQLRILAKGM
jgi:hypothetical protein